jgi:hypothetical protein
MDLSQQKEQFSIAYVRAIASVAGYTVYRPEVDDDSVDLGIALRGGAGTVRSPRLELQLKCTADPIWQADPLRFSLKKKNYDDLRHTDVLVPRLLVVVCVPATIDLWLEQSETQLALHRCGYYVSLRSLPERSDIETAVTIAIPRQQQLTVVALQSLMTMISTGAYP